MFFSDTVAMLKRQKPDLANDRILFGKMRLEREGQPLSSFGVAAGATLYHVRDVSEAIADGSEVATARHC